MDRGFPALEADLFVCPPLESPFFTCALRIGRLLFAMREILGFENW
jgi:hypothetical protein